MPDTYKEITDFSPYHQQQNEMKEKVIREDRLAQDLTYIAGADVAYDEANGKMIGAVVVLDAERMEVIEEAHHEMDIRFPYVPGLFSFREIPPLLASFEKLKTKPQLIICDGHGIAHPKGVGMATHLGIELNLPSIGCGKSRLIGDWNKEELAEARGSCQPLVYKNQEVGVVLRTQDNIKPVFVSIGHKVSLSTSISLTLQMCAKYRLPETTRAADALVNRLMKERHINSNQNHKH